MNTPTPDTMTAIERELAEWKQLATMRCVELTAVTDQRDEAREDLEFRGFLYVLQTERLKRIERERDEARAETIRWMSIAEGRGRTDDEPDIQAELAEAYAKLDRILKLTIHDDTFWAIEEIARISGGESDCSVCGGCFMIPGSEENDDVMNTPCPKCNAPATISNQ